MCMHVSGLHNDVFIRAAAAARGVSPPLDVIITSQHLIVAGAGAIIIVINNNMTIKLAADTAILYTSMLTAAMDRLPVHRCRG